jgi:hypothetical protein
VVIPTFNRGWCIRQAVQSVLNTHYPALEVIIVDDGSTDATRDILKSMSSNNSRHVNIYSHPDNKNCGIAASRNLGIKKASGKYIAFLDSDDLYLPHRFNFSIPWLEENAHVLAAVEPYLLSNFGDELNAVLKKHLTEIQTSDEKVTDWLKAMLEKSIYWQCSVITMRRKAIELAGWFDPKYPWAEETPMWLKLAASNAVGAVQNHTPTALVRRHQEHSHGKDQIGEFLVYLEVLLDAMRWTKLHQNIVPAAAREVVRTSLERFAIELVANPNIPLKQKLSSSTRAFLSSPGLSTNCRLIANLVYSLKAAPGNRQ